MQEYYFGERSKDNLIFVRPDLVMVAHRALELSEVDFAITEGARSIERQKELLTSGDSWIMDSRHLIRPGEAFCHAFDLAAYIKNKISWEEKFYNKIAKSMFRAAIELDTQIEWGGFWLTDDGPHWQLSRKEYP